MSEVSDETLAELVALAEAATPGEWVQEPDTMAGRVWVKSRKWYGGMDMEPLFQVRDEKEYAQRERDAALVVAAVNALPALVAEVQRHRAVMVNLDALPEQMAEAWGGDASWFTTGTKVAALVAAWLTTARTEAT